jgi:hypothetical protein
MHSAGLVRQFENPNVRIGFGSGLAGAGRRGQASKQKGEQKGPHRRDSYDGTRRLWTADPQEV